jgi:hypothetical protein
MDQDRKRHLRWRLSAALIVCAGFALWKSVIWGVALFACLMLASFVIDRFSK